MQALSAASERTASLRVALAMAMPVLAKLALLIHDGLLTHAVHTQALSAAVQRTHSWRIALALAVPVLAQWASAGCVLGESSRWRSMQCSIAEVPMLHLLLLQVLLIAAAAASGLVAGQSFSTEVHPSRMA